MPPIVQSGIGRRLFWLTTRRRRSFGVWFDVTPAQATSGHEAAPLCY